MYNKLISAERIRLQIKDIRSKAIKAKQTRAKSALCFIASYQQVISFIRSIIFPYY